MNSKKIVHMTSAHPRNDVRIIVKICSSLAKAGYEVCLVVADGKGYEKRDNIEIYDIGKPSRRLERMLKTTLMVYKRALFINGDIYHIHDPELLPFAYLLKLKGKKVIFDSHEDVPRQILSKPYLYPPLSKIISETYELFEKNICKKLDFIITATAFIRDIFIKFNKNTIDIKNYPIVGNCKINELNKNSNRLCYAGAITSSRGCKEMIQAMELVKNDIRLCLAGDFDESIDLMKIKKERGWLKTDYKGFLNQMNLKSLLQDSFAGIVTIHPTVNYIDSLPTKLFDYMLAGIPIIASNFPKWKDIVEGNKCGICVDPLKPDEIAKAIDFLFEHPEEAKQMGLNGQKLVLEKYNWENEEKKLLDVYERLS